MQATDFLLAAKDLLKVDEGEEPREANLRKACSATYYAIFHTLCETCANTLIGEQDLRRAWTHVYRALDHGKAKNNCVDTEMITKFPEDVQDFAGRFVTMQEKRHRADYDPAAPIFKSEVETDIEAAQGAIEAFCAVEEKHKRAFAAYMILGKPRRL